MTATRLQGPQDLLVVSAGPGHFSTMVALAGEARRAGARVVALTARPADELAVWADVVVQVPAQTLADQRGSVLPMGSSYELALQLFLDCVALLLVARLAIPADGLEARHTNLE